MKFRQVRIKPWRFGARRVNAGYHIFKTNSLVKVLKLTLTHREIHV